MGLNTRSIIDPRMPFAMRASFAGAMWASVIVYSSASIADIGTVLWDADNVNPALNKPRVPFTHTKLYVGQARIQPNHDVRARPGQDVGQDVTQQSIRVQLDYAGNTLVGKDLPQLWDSISAGDLVTVTKVFTTPDGTPVDNGITKFDYNVSLVNLSSNSAVKGLLCEVIGQDVGGPRGNL